jgi:hypothetical protein
MPSSQTWAIQRVAERFELGKEVDGRQEEEIALVVVVNEPWELSVG